MRSLAVVLLLALSFGAVVYAHCIVDNWTDCSGANTTNPFCGGEEICVVHQGQIYASVGPAEPVQLGAVIVFVNFSPSIAPRISPRTNAPSLALLQTFLI